MQLTDNQFTPYARSLVKMTIEAHIEALRTMPTNQATEGRIDGIIWLANMIGIDVTDLYGDDDITAAPANAKAAS